MSGLRRLLLLLPVAIVDDDVLVRLVGQSGAKPRSQAGPEYDEGGSAEQEDDHQDGDDSGGDRSGGGSSGVFNDVRLGADLGRGRGRGRGVLAHARPVVLRIIAGDAFALSLRLVLLVLDTRLVFAAAEELVHAAEGLDRLSVRFGAGRRTFRYRDFCVIEHRFVEDASIVDAGPRLESELQSVPLWNLLEVNLQDSCHHTSELGGDGARDHGHIEQRTWNWILLGMIKRVRKI